MKKPYTAVIKHSGAWWIGWIEEVPGVNCQEGTREELLETLRTTLREESDLNRKEALEAAGSEYEEEPYRHMKRGELSEPPPCTRMRASAGRRPAFLVAQPEQEFKVSGTTASRNRLRFG